MNTRLTKATRAEITFVMGLGRWSSATLHEPRTKLLRSYERAMRLRERWDDIDPKDVAFAVAGAIAKEEAREEARA